MENKKRTDLEECVIHYNGNYYLKTDVGYKKIILTTDQDLIKEGVQAIDDEFLEWFVKNPSCERVEIKKGSYNLSPMEEMLEKEYVPKGTFDTYKIIIPQEEPKQETLEEAAEKYVDINYPNYIQPLEKAAAIEDFIAGAKWQAEISYSEEEVRKIAWDGRLFFHENKDTPFSNMRTSFIKWFEQFKKQ
jgi:hypothetical protein